MSCVGLIDANMQAVLASEVFSYLRKKLLAIAHFEIFVLAFSVLAFSVAPSDQSRAHV